MTRIPESTLTDNFRDGDPWDAQTLNKIVAVLIAGINANYEDILEAVMTPGPQGPVGPQGPEGPQGPQGVEGPVGPQGIEGPQGPQGDKGDKGDTVVSLEVGTTTTVSSSTPASVENVGTATEAVLNFNIPQGPKGDKGDTGLTGPKGDKGDTGPKGDTGLTGLTGPKGDKGAKGDIGLTGPKGDKGDTGAGVITGGTTGQALVKKSATAYDTEWKTLQGLITLPEYSVPSRTTGGTGPITGSIRVVQGGAEANSLARRTPGGQVFVATPTDNNHAANKSYADKKRPRCYTAMKNRATINITQTWTKFDAGPLYYFNSNDTSIASIQNGDLVIASGITKVLMSAHCELLDTGPGGDISFQIRNSKDNSMVREAYQSGGNGWKFASIGPIVVNVNAGDKFDLAISCGSTGNRDIGICYLTIVALD